MLRTLLPHPALRQLFVLRSRARLRRLKKSISSPRHLVLTITAIVLPVVWVINFAAGMLLRERFSVEAFRNGVLVTGLGYFLWYVLKACVSRPPAAIEWTPTERMWLCGGPFGRGDLIRYRLTVIFTATFVKASLISVMFLPELTLWVAGFAGLLLGLAFLDLARMAAETVMSAVPQRIYQRVRGVVLVCAGATGAIAGVSAVTVAARTSTPLPAAVTLPIEFVRQLAALRKSVPGQILSAPLVPFAEVITAPGISLMLVWWLMVSVWITFGLAAAVIRLDAYFAARSVETARRTYASAAAARTRRPTAPERTRLPMVTRLKGAGPIAWRQWLGARKYETGLVCALSVPAVLSCLPLMHDGESVEMFLNVAGTLCLYSFLLLPSALKFDFRRDYDRLPVLKTLPVQPLAVVLGQLATPVLIAMLFQVLVLGIAFIFRPVPLIIAANAVLMIIPLNIAIFGLDNLIYLMYPYRQSEEGLQPFVRATLTFTAKGLLFAIALAVVYLWAVSCRRLSQFALFSLFGDHRMLFAAGLWTMMVAAAALLTLCSARQFARFDPTTDHFA
jgi:hypothetical protein